MALLAVLGCLLLMPAAGSAQSVYACTNGTASFFSSAPLEDIEARSGSLNSVLNMATGEVVFIVPMRSFEFDKSLMQEHFNERYVESHKYPRAVYKGRLEGHFDAGVNGKYTVISTGTLDLHNVSVQRTDTGILVVTDSVISLSAKFKIAVADHHIEIPKLVTRNIAEVVEVSFNAIYRPYRKKTK